MPKKNFSLHWHIIDIKLKDFNRYQWTSSKNVIDKTVLHSVNQIFKYESFLGTNVRSYYYSVMFGSHNEDNVLKAQTKENLELSKYQVNVTS